MSHMAAPEGAGKGGSLAPGRAAPPGHGRVRLLPRRWALDWAQGLTKECSLGHFPEPRTPIGPALLRRLWGERTRPRGRSPFRGRRGSQLTGGRLCPSGWESRCSSPKQGQGRKPEPRMRPDPPLGQPPPPGPLLFPLVGRPLEAAGAASVGPPLPSQPVASHLWAEGHGQGLRQSLGQRSNTIFSFW